MLTALSRVVKESLLGKCYMLFWTGDGDGAGRGWGRGGHTILRWYVFNFQSESSITRWTRGTWPHVTAAPSLSFSSLVPRLSFHFSPLVTYFFVCVCWFSFSLIRRCARCAFGPVWYWSHITDRWPLPPLGGYLFSSLLFLSSFVGFVGDCRIAKATMTTAKKWN